MTKLIFTYIALSFTCFSGFTQKNTSTNLKTINETIIGQTSYDLQTNSSNGTKLFFHSDGTVSACWTQSSSFNFSFPDRGTGYNYFNGVSWASIPSSKQETTERTGWSSVGITSIGEEIIVAHSDSGKLSLLKRPSKGTGVWNESYIPSDSLIGCCLLWPKITVGGTNGQSVHIIAVTAPTSFNGTLYKGADGALLYYKSTDGGNTFTTINVVIPDTDTSNYIGFDADEYAIDSKGDTIAIAVFGKLKDVFLLKSTDNGISWSKTIIDSFPIPKYKVDMGTDIDNDGIFDTILSSDGSGSVLIDTNGNVHVWYGSMRYLDNDLTDANFLIFPETNGLMYWSETMGILPPKIISTSIDFNLNGKIDVVGIPKYNLSLTTMPSSGISSNGTIYVSYSAHMENVSTVSQNYRHLFIIASEDNGSTWSTPVDLSSVQKSECIFSSMAKNVSDKIRLIYQRDAEPGISIKGDNDPLAINDIVYLTIDTLDIVGVKEQIHPINDLLIYPNPASENITINFPLKEAGIVSISISNVMGQNILDIKNEWSAAGNHSVNIPLTGLTKGIYFVNVTNGNSISSRKLVIN